jgi:hypothetical protein
MEHILDLCNEAGWKQEPDACPPAFKGIHTVSYDDARKWTNADWSSVLETDKHVLIYGVPPGSVDLAWDSPSLRDVLGGMDSPRDIQCERLGESAGVLLTPS